MINRFVFYESHYHLCLFHDFHSINVDKNTAEEAFLHIFSLGHAALVFVNKQSIGE